MLFIEVLLDGPELVLFLQHLLHWPHPLLLHGNHGLRAQLDLPRLRNVDHMEPPRAIRGREVALKPKQWPVVSYKGRDGLIR